MHFELEMMRKWLTYLLFIAVQILCECIVLKTTKSNVWPPYAAQHDDKRYKQLIAQVFNITTNTSTSKSIIEHRPCPGGWKCVPSQLCSSDAYHHNDHDVDDHSQLDQKMAVVIHAEPMRFCKGPNEVCCTDSDEKIVRIPPGCGHHLPQNQFESRIAGGGQTGIGEFPWMIAILQRDKVANKFRYLCGGSLIHPSIVMTAAHTIAGKSIQQLISRGGEWDLKSSMEMYAHEDRAVTRVIIHTEFNNNTLANDIALLQLDWPFQIGTNINTICLPPANVFTDANVRCTATGWGRNRADGKYQSIMQRIQMSIVAHWMCQNRLRQTRLGRYYRLHRGFLCAGGERGNDTCKGNGGSPLVCRVPNSPSDRFYQAGIVAGGIGCGRGVPGIYVNVAWYINWIWRQMNLMGVNVAAKDSLNFDDFF